MNENFYGILGLSKDATESEIKKAYRRLSLQYHPDKNSNDEEKNKLFCKVSNAYQVLSDPEKRKSYDFSLNSGMSYNEGDSETFTEFSNNINLDDILKTFLQMNLEMRDHHEAHFRNNHMFANMFERQQPPEQVDNIVKCIDITLDDVYYGPTVPIEINRAIVKNGQRYSEMERLYITIPKGSDTNDRIIINGKGHYINQICSDIEVIINVLQHNHYKRNGLTLLITKDITLKESLCGFVLDLEYFDKVYKLRNKPGQIITPTTIKILDNMGLTNGLYTGNLEIKFNIIFPISLSLEIIETLNKNLP